MEGDVFATSGSDRGIALYDLRSATPIRKLVMQVTSFEICKGGLGRLGMLLPGPADPRKSDLSVPTSCAALAERQHICCC